MPGLTSLPLNLSEILEARKGPLRELEIWALLCQCAEELQDLIIKGAAFGDGAFRHMITPNSLLVRDNGTTVLAENMQSSQGSLYIAPENNHEGHQGMSEAAFEKMFVYSLGRTLQVASEFGLQENEVLGISYDLDSLLQAMSEKNPTFRLSLMQIFDACLLQASQNPDKMSHSLVLSRLYKSILGGQHKKSFDDSNYGSEHSHRLVMSHEPGRARRPRPLLRHRRHGRGKRRGHSESSSDRSPTSRSRSRSRSPKHRSGRQTRGAGQNSNDVHEVPVGSKSDSATSARTTPVRYSNALNTSGVSSSSELSNFGKIHQVPPYSAAHSVQGLLGLRQGSPAYQKYIRLKERQMRLRQAKSGQVPTAMDELRSRLMTPPLMSMEMMDNVSETHSMASLMSYTLGTYKPYLHAEYGSEAALNLASDPGADTSSQMSLFAGIDYGMPLRAQAVPVTAFPSVPDNEQTVIVADVESAVPSGDLLTSHSNEPTCSAQSLRGKQTSNSMAADEGLKEKTRKADSSPTRLATSEVDKEHGPEFVANMKKSAVHVAMPLHGDSIKNTSLARKVTIVHLTGRKFDIVLDPSSTGRQLYDTVIPYLDVDDFFFFGLTYISDGEHFFLDGDTKLHKVSPEGWREGPKGHQSHVNFILNVRVKFYPDSLTDFRHTSSQHLLYLQLRKDVLEDRVMCDLDLLYKLAGAALQAEYGDYSDAMENSQTPYFTAEYYVPGRVLRQNGASLVYSKVIQMHKTYKNLSTYQAEMEYIKYVRRHPEYGIHFYKLFKTKTLSGMQIWVGLSQHSLVVAEPSPTVPRVLTQGHPWNSILKISFNKKRFSVQPKVENPRGKPPKINFYTNSYRKGRYLLQFSTEQHRFEIRMKTRITQPELLAGDLNMEDTPQMVDSGVGDDVVGEEPTISVSVADTTKMQTLSGNSNFYEDDHHHHPQSQIFNEQPPQQPIRYRSPPAYEPPAMAQILGGDQVFPGSEFSPLHASVTDLRSSGFDKDHSKTLLDMSSTTQGLDSASASNAIKQVASSDPLLKQSDMTSPAGRRIFEVTLEKEPVHGVGITIVGGETTSSLDLGIFIKSVVPGGPADRDGRIKSGDRLIAIGGSSLEGKQHHEAVAMIRDSGSTVTLFVSQVRPPGTMKKRQLVEDQQAAFDRKLRDSIAQYNKPVDEDYNFYLNSEHLTGDFDNGNINGDSRNTFFHSNDFMYKHKAHSYSESDPECYSDEENYPLNPPLHSSPLRNKTSSIINKQAAKQNPHHLRTAVAPQELFSSNENFTSLQSLRPSAFQQPESRRRREISNELLNDPDNDEDSVKLQQDERLARELQRDRELAEDPQELMRDLRILPDIDRARFLDEDNDQEDLQILGDIAAIEAHDSSSDSDFDSAIKKTIDGHGTRISPTTKAVNTVRPMVFATPNDRKSDGLLSTDIVYEAFIEKDDNGFGIIIDHPVALDPVRDGVYIKDVVSGSPAHKGGILLPGDRILEVAGLNVIGKESKEVELFLKTAPSLAIIKVSRTLDKDVGLNYMTQYPPSKENEAVVPQHLPAHYSPPQAPEEIVPILEGELHIVPPPPPAPLHLPHHPVEESESNTQSDVDSDVLDSSRSEVESQAMYALHHPVASTIPEGNPNWELNPKPLTGLIDQAEIWSTTTDSVKLDDSGEFEEQLNALKNAMDERNASADALQEQFDRDADSPGTLSRSSGSSSTGSIVRSPRKIIESLGSKSKADEDYENVDDDDDKTVVDAEAGQGIIDPFEPVLMSVSLKRTKDGFGFTVAGGVSTGGCYIKQLVSEPAISDDRIRPGDKIIQVNGKDTTSMGHIETVNVLRQISNVAHLQLLRFPSTMETQQRIEVALAQAQVASGRVEIQRQPVDDDLTKTDKQDVFGVAEVVIEPYDNKTNDAAQAVSRGDEFTLGQESGTKQSVETGVFRVDLFQPHDSAPALGIVLTQREEEGQALICVKRLKPGYTASNDGRLEKGDIILQVNGTSFVGMSVGKAVNFLKETKGKLILTISRSKQDEKDEDSDDVCSDEEQPPQGTEEVDNHGVGQDVDALALERPASRASGVSRVSDNYDSWRKPDSDVPVILTEQWLNGLPLMRMAVVQPSEHMKAVLQVLADLVESGEPAEAFKKIRQLNKSGQCSVGELAIHKQKNRYRNVVPYDFNRVKLLGRDEDNDYINASYVEMPLTSYSRTPSTHEDDAVDTVTVADKDNNREKDAERAKDTKADVASIVTTSSSTRCLKYIACQGPVESTVPDMWVMIWQEKVHVVVMLTKTQEGNKVKCYPYWPRSKAEILQVDGGALKVQLLRDYSLSDLHVIQVVIAESATGQKQEVTLLQYMSWPDHGAPDTGLSLLRLLQVMHLLEAGSPPVIHCSAGIGRSGALVAIDVALACIEYGVKFNFYDIVSKLRKQRYGMIQTTDQYLFCYTACMEALLSMDS